MAARHPVAALIALSVGILVYVTGEALPIGLLLSMAADLEVSAARVGLLVTAYGAVVVLATIPLTVLTRTVPRRPLLSVLLGGFVVTTVIAALADSFWLLLAMRMVGAATQALFWAVVVPAAAGLFRPELKGRAVAVVFAGSTVGLAVALPAATWLGQLAGWRVAFLALAGVGLAACVTVAAVLPSSRPDEGHAARGAAPDSRRFWLLVIVATLGTTGAIVAYTYVTTFVTEVSGLAADSMHVVLLARGVASLAGIAIVAAIVDRWPRSVLTWTVAVQAAALLGLYGWGRGAFAAVVLFSTSGSGLRGAHRGDGRPGARGGSRTLRHRRCRCLDRRQRGHQRRRSGRRPPALGLRRTQHRPRRRSDHRARARPGPRRTARLREASR